MPRSLSTPLDSALNAPITSVGYALQWNFGDGSVSRMSDIGTITVDGDFFVGVDFDVQGLVQDPDVDFQASFKAQNLDNAIAALFMNSDIPAITVDIWQFERSVATTYANMTKLCTLVISSLQFTVQSLSISLMSASQYSTFAPRRRVQPAFGFNYAMPPFSQIAWQSEIYVVAEGK